MFSFILVVSRGYILLISICPMWLEKAGKLHSAAISSATLPILFKNFFKGEKIW